MLTHVIHLISIHFQWAELCLGSVSLCLSLPIQSPGVRWRMASAQGNAAASMGQVLLVPQPPKSTHLHFVEYSTPLVRFFWSRDCNDSATHLSFCKDQNIPLTSQKRSFQVQQSIARQQQTVPGSMGASHRLPRGWKDQWRAPCWLGSWWRPWYHCGWQATKGLGTGFFLMIAW